MMSTVSSADGTVITPAWIQQCEQEPLHLSAAIQPHGALIGIAEDGRVIHVSANAKTLLETTCSIQLGEPAPDILTRLISPALSTNFGSRAAFDFVPIGSDGHVFDVVNTRAADGSIFLELTPANGSWNTVNDGLIAPHFLRQEAQDPVPNSPAELALAEQVLTQAVAALTGFERVMYYRFREDGDGEVVAEVLQGTGYGSYFGLRYPASDVPQIARKLYVLNPWRMIPDAAASSVPVHSLDQVPDLTHVDLRSISPVHQAYLANMAVGASLSFPVVVQGELYALLAAHQSNPETLCHEVLQRTANKVQGHAKAVTKYSLHRRMQLADMLEHEFSRLVPLLNNPEMLLDHWREIANSLCNTFQCDGVALARADHILEHGVCFEPTALAFVHAHQPKKEQAVWMSDSLVRDIPDYPTSEIAGALVIRLGSSSSKVSWLCMTRIEYIHEVAWGGNPEKPIEQGPSSLKISPRRSFEKWIQKRTGFSRQWTNEQRLLAMKFRSLFAEPAGVR